MHEALIMTCQNRTIVVEAQVLQEIKQFKQCLSSQPEQGGILLGEWRGLHMRITSITRPQPTDKASRFSFVRCGRTHSKLIREEWEKSDGATNYLGEWHTHPEPHPTPSAIDYVNWKLLNGRDPVLLIIQGTVSIWCGLLIDGQFLTLTNDYSQY
ncbi:Mov34/MPN/PAD-1 family protein [Vibrio sp. YIC-376]|uniref:Mov34/MPN/PAD-1 family protein n=1 Tax=Vibrio sp. YIC-376 TaxID=3136162 RepID=UPI00402A6B14